MNWTIKLEFSETDDFNKNLEPLIYEIAKKTDSLIGKEPTLGYNPIIITNDLYSGMRLNTPLNNEFYKLGLTVGHHTFGKVAYQFSNLLSLLYTDPRQVTWFSQSLAHMSSFWFLDYLSNLWYENCPHPRYEGIYKVFEALKTEKIKTAYQNIDIMLNLATNEWIKEEIKQLCDGSNYTSPIMLDHIGLELLPMFQEEEAWRILGYVGQATSKPIQDINDLRSRPRAKPDFELLRSIVPSELKPLVERMVAKLLL